MDFYEIENETTATVTIRDLPDGLEEVRQRTRLWRALALLANTVAWLLIAAAVLAAATAVGVLIDSRTAEAQTASYEGSDLEAWLEEQADEHQWLRQALAASAPPRVCTAPELVSEFEGARINGRAHFDEHRYCMHPAISADVGWASDHRSRFTAVHELAHLWYWHCAGWYDAAVDEARTDLLAATVLAWAPGGDKRAEWGYLPEFGPDQFADAVALYQRTLLVECQPAPEPALTVVGETAQLPDLLPWCVEIYERAGGHAHVVPWQRGICRQLLIDYWPWAEARSER